MKKAPVVSIILPLYNKRTYVRRAIESIQQQTFSDWELIIVDDGSTDGSSDEIPLYDQKMRYYKQVNAGPASARNRGIREARGELITFLDADDYYYPQKIEEEVKQLYFQKKADWMLSPGDSERSSRLNTFKIRNINGKNLNTSVLVNNAFNSLSLKGVPVDGICLKKNLIEDIGGFNDKLRCFEITEFLILCALKQPRVFVNATPLFRVIKVPNSAFSIAEDRVKSLVPYGESLMCLSIEYPEYSKALKNRARNIFINYAIALVNSGRSVEARMFLYKRAPYVFYKKWWKVWIMSCLPVKLLMRYRAIS